MNAESIIAVSAAVVALTQLLKWSGLNDYWGPIVVLALSAVGVAFYGWSQQTYSRADAFQFFAAWVTVATSASGVYGFTRATASAVLNVTSPPADGAGSSRTFKSGGDV